MAKAKKTVFFCQECGYESPKWMGQCPGCKSWNTFVEETVSPNQTKHQEATGRKKAEPVALSEISLDEEDRIHNSRQIQRCRDSRNSHESGYGDCILT